MRNQSLINGINRNDRLSNNRGNAINEDSEVDEQQDFESQVELYEYILQKQNFLIDRDVSRGEAACLTHILFKIIVCVTIYFKPFLRNYFVQENFLHEIMFFFSVVDFWFTKNYSGRKLAGLSWSFGRDLTGKQRFKFEYRINQQFVSRTNYRVFWMAEVVYLLFILMYYYVQGIQYDLQSSRIFQFALIFFASTLTLINLLLFYKASTYASRKKIILKQRLPLNYLPKFGNNSLISFV